MKCEEVESVMIDYLDNMLEKTKRDAVERHLETCEGCLDELKDFQHILQTVESAELEQPNDSLRTNFYHMLQREVKKLAPEEKKSSVFSFSSGRFSPIMNLAAGIALLIAGTLLGLLIHQGINPGNDKTQLLELKNEVQTMKELVMLSMLKEESPSQRIQAVSYSEEMMAPDGKILEALTNTLNKDKNVNVRLAALYSLAKYADRQSVRDSLVESLYRQTEPIIQVVLINILVDKNENKALKPMKQIISNKNTLQDVKEVAQKGIKILL
jgi:hypothetical protein